jgi:hypothetical protein
MKNVLFITTLVSFFCISVAQGQNTGFGGKRVLLKTDVLNGLRSPLVNASAEFIVTRGFTFSVGYRATKGKYNQIYYSNEYQSNYYSSEESNKLPKQAEIKSRTIMLEARLYFAGVLPAPRGFFFYGSYNYGKLDVTGNYYSSLLENNPNNNSSYNKRSNDLFLTYEAEKVLAIGVEAGLGYQSFIAKNVTLGFKVGFNKTFFNADGKYEDKVLSGVAKTYGSNFFRLSPTSLNLFPTPYNDDDDSGINIDNNYYKGSFGVAFYVQVGILLF